MKKFKYFSILLCLILFLNTSTSFAEYVFENGNIDNIAPITSFEPKLLNKKNVDIVLITDYTGSRLNNIQSQINEIGIQNKNELNLNLTTVDKNFLSTIDLGTQETTYPERQYAWYYEYYYKITDGERCHTNRYGDILCETRYTRSEIKDIQYNYKYNRYTQECEYEGKTTTTKDNKGETGKVIIKNKYLKPGESVPNDRFPKDTGYEKYSKDDGNDYFELQNDYYYFPKAKEEFSIITFYGSSCGITYIKSYTEPKITYSDKYRYLDTKDKDCTSNIKTLDFSEFNSKVKLQENSDVYVIFALNNEETNFYNSDIYNQNCKNNYMLGTMRYDNVGRFIRDNKATVYSCCSDKINSINLSSSSYKIDYKDSSNKQNVTINSLIDYYASLGIKYDNYDKVISSIKNNLLVSSENLDIIVASDKDTNYFTSKLENNISSDINLNITQFDKSKVIDRYERHYFCKNDIKKSYIGRGYRNYGSFDVILLNNGTLLARGSNILCQYYNSAVYGLFANPQIKVIDEFIKIKDNIQDYYIYKSDGRYTLILINNDGEVLVRGYNRGGLGTNFKKEDKDKYLQSFHKMNNISNAKEIKKLVVESDYRCVHSDYYGKDYKCKIGYKDEKTSLIYIGNDGKQYGIGNNKDWFIDSYYNHSTCQRYSKIKIRYDIISYDNISDYYSPVISTISHKKDNNYSNTISSSYEFEWGTNVFNINGHKLFVNFNGDIGYIEKSNKLYEGNIGSYLDKEEIEVKAIDLEKMKNTNLQKNSERYFIYISDNYSTDTLQDKYFPLGNLNQDFLNYLKDNNFNIYVVTPSKALDVKLESPQIPTMQQTRTIQDMLDCTDKETVKFKNTTQIINVLSKKYKNYKTELTKEGYVIVDEDSLDYSTNYQDYENDPQYKAKWIFVHDPHVFENNDGMAEFSGKQLDNPIETFHKTGRYYVSYIAQDNPYDNYRFANYRRWSKKARTIINVHHRPIALCSLKKSGTRLHVYDYSYDLDHVLENKKGIVEHSWKWHYSDETSFKVGYPPKSIQDKHIIVRLKVKDKEGAWSRTYETATFNNENIAPIASFTLDKYQMSKGKENKINDFSYDPDNDPIKRHWYVLNQYNTIIKNCSSNKPDLSKLNLGKCKIKLVVTDNPKGRDALLEPLSSQCIQELEVKNMQINHKPIADFEVMPNPQLVDNKLDYIDKSYDPDIWDNIILYEWSYSTNNNKMWTTPTDNPQEVFKKAGIYKVRLRVQDAGNEEYPPMWSDYCIREVNILPNNTRPNAAFSVTPNPQLVNEELTYINNSNANDEWDEITESIYSYSTNNEKTWSEWISKPPESFNTEGSYVIRRKVKDRGNVLSKGMWSYIYTRRVTILPQNTKPTALFTVNPNPQYIGEPLNYNDKSTPNDNWDTIVKHEWSYSLDNGKIWSKPTAKPPKIFNDLLDVEIRLRVKDKGNELSLGLWSDYCYKKVNIVCKENNRPLASFSVPSKVLENEKFSYKNNSHEGRNPKTKEYDRNWGDKLTKQKWSYYKKDINNWSSESDTPPSSFSQYGTYYISLRVKDKGNEQYSALWSDYCTRTLEVLPINHKPTADFTIEPAVQIINEPVKFIDKSYDKKDIWDTIDGWEWSWRKKGQRSFKVWSTDKIPKDLIFKEKGLYEIRLKIKDKGNELSPALWSDYFIKELEIIDLNVTASLSPNPAKQGQQVTFTVNTQGNAKQLEIIFPNEIQSLDNPLDTELPIIKNILVEPRHTEIIKYYLPLETPLTLDNNSIRIKNKYPIIIKARRDRIERAVTLYLDIKGNILDGLKTEIKH